MSPEVSVAPRSEGSLRDAIRAGLGSSWTMKLEDALFWSTSEFVSRVAINASKRSVQSDSELIEALEAIKAYVESR